MIKGFFEFECRRILGVSKFFVSTINARLEVAGSEDKSSNPVDVQKLGIVAFGSISSQCHVKIPIITSLLIRGLF